MKNYKFTVFKKGVTSNPFMFEVHSENDRTRKKDKFSKLGFEVKDV